MVDILLLNVGQRLVLTSGLKPLDSSPSKVSSSFYKENVLEILLSFVKPACTTVFQSCCFFPFDHVERVFKR